MVRGLAMLAVMFGAIFATPAKAMNWCALPQIVPKLESDLERLAPTVAALTGCPRQASDTAHQARWVCPDDPATSEVYEGVHITYIREPGRGLYLAVIAVGMRDLDILRRCGLRDLKDEPRFVPGNVTIIDRVRIGMFGARLTLSSAAYDGVAAIVSDHTLVTEDANAEAMLEGVHGIKAESYPSTSVKLAGQSPVGTPVAGIVSAFEARGSVIHRTEEQGRTFPKWFLSPPVGLGGVREVTVEGFMAHLLRAEYVLESTADYERFIGLLDTEYGRSRRSAQDGCTYRWWESGRVSIQGEHCPGKSDTLTFFNDVASDQLEQVVAKYRADEARRGTEAKRPTIDSDMF